MDQYQPWLSLQVMKSLGGPMNEAVQKPKGERRTRREGSPS
jgi:hypothetical protein